MDNRTNVMRKLDQMKLPYKPHSYAETDALSGVEVAQALNQDPRRVFKTLVTVGKSKKYFVFMVPVAEELDLKKAASAVGEKSIEMIKSKDLLSVTGYIHGGCSPIGMKKVFTTVIHRTAADFETIFFSAGKIGYQVEMNLEDLKRIVDFEMAEIIEN